MTTHHTIMRRSMRALALVTTLSAVSAGALSAQATPAAAVTATGAWVREAPAGRKVTAIFLTAQNTSGTARSIVSGSTDVSDTLELHEMKRENGMMRMSPVSSIVVPANGKAELRPGGLHLMLFGLKRPLVAGDSVHVTLTLDSGARVSFVAPVRAMGSMP
ncbi:MAG: copper chaperone PCu(A)C [Gemmatimonadaceae bacterium]|nr:copper chaperone PCu(A)C [Gemmatimonadaceae bacterium]